MSQADGNANYTQLGKTEVTKRRVVHGLDADAIESMMRTLAHMAHKVLASAYESRRIMLRQRSMATTPAFVPTAGRNILAGDLRFGPAQITK